MKFLITFVVFVPAALSTATLRRDEATIDKAQARLLIREIRGNKAENIH